MAKKKYKGVVISEFSVGYKSGTVRYSVGDEFSTENKLSFDHLINSKRIKQ